jgi:hypothetical protein
VKADLRKLWISDQQNVLNRQKADAAAKDLQSGKKTLEQIAQETHAQVQSVTMKRQGDPPDPMTSSAKSRLFDIAKGAGALVPAKNGYAVAQVTAIRLPDIDKISAGELKDTTRAAVDTSKNEYLMAYVDYLRGKYKWNINEEVLKQMYGGSDETADGKN